MGMLALYKVLINTFLTVAPSNDARHIPNYHTSNTSDRVYPDIRCYFTIHSHHTKRPPTAHHCPCVLRGAQYITEHATYAHTPHM